MLHKLAPLILIYCCFPFNTYAQEVNLDSLRSILHSEAIKSLSFDKHIKVQREYPNIDQDLTIAYGEALVAREDFMRIDSLKAQAYFELGYNYRNWGNNSKTKSYLTESLALFEKLKDVPGQTNATNLLAVYYANIDKDSTAIHLYTETIRLAQSIRDTVKWISPYKGLSSLFAKLGLNDKCIAYSEEGLLLARKIDHKLNIAALSNNMAIGYYQKEDYATCVKYLNEALVINKQLELTEATIRNLSNIGAVYQKTGDIPRATKYMEEAESLLSKINIPRTNVYTYIELAKLRNLQMDYMGAIGYANRAIEIGKTAGIESIADGAYANLSDAYKGLRQPKEALSALEKYWEIQSKFLETERNESIANVEQEFQQFKKEAEIETQKSEISLLKKDQTLGKTQRNGAIALSFLLGIVALLYFNRFRIKKKAEELLQVKNEKIEKQSDLIQTSLTEKETLLREIHHRVKNNLQIISSLLNIQSSNIEDPDVLSSIKEGQSRVQAMSLIHQNLYQSVHINDVDIQNYLKELVNYLSDMFTGTDKSVQVVIDAKDIKFDIDTAIPLGLIVNELVSNAYKYAFKKRDKGKIKIAIKAVNEVDYELHVDDDGEGLPDDFDPKKSKSLGLKLVKILSKQLRGKFTSSSKYGANFTAFFKDIRAYQNNI
ncbi:MAG: two-component sensor histidine kinase [Algoriphagus sp.]|jgi:two-component sensor histidine kinase